MGVGTFVGEKTTGKRAGRRARVLLAARLRTARGEIDARLRDLSPRGALVECATMPPAGERVTFVRGETEVPARIAWAAGGRIGLEFEFAIDAQEVLVQLGKGIKPDDPYRRAALHGNLTDDELRLARAWGVAVGLNISDRRTRGK